MTAASPDASLIGGCLCGQLRYEGRDLIDAGYCHCRLCQRSSGAPVLAWATLKAAGFAYTRGQSTAYSSSNNGLREFCAECGTQILFRDRRHPERVDVNIASLDEPDQVEPHYHIWLESRIRWFEIDDELPRYADEGPDIATPLGRE
jgi:hypothetical protein